MFSSLAQSYLRSTTLQAKEPQTTNTNLPKDSDVTMEDVVDPKKSRSDSVPLQLLKLLNPVILFSPLKPLPPSLLTLLLRHLLLS